MSSEIFFDDDPFAGTPIFIDRPLDRCEWIYIDGNRCRNVLNLKKHHRSYDRFGHEDESDFSILCPVHHLLADIERKKRIGTRQDMLSEWLSFVIDRIKRKSNNERFMAFLNRLVHEEKRFYRSADLGAMSIVNIAERARVAVEDDQKMVEIHLEKSEIEILERACWYILIINLCVKDNNFERMSAWASKVMQELNRQRSY